LLSSTPGPPPFHAVYLTAYGPIYCASAAYRRATRLAKWRDQFAYLEAWAQFQFLEGRDIIGHPENQLPKVKA